MARLRTWFSRRGAIARRLIALALVFSVISSVLWFIPTRYFVTAPGAAIDTSRMVQVTGGQVRSGRLYMLILSTQPANLFWYLYAKVDHRADLETKEQFLEGYVDYNKYVELTRQMMVDSQLTAKAVALQQLGYGQGVRSAGVHITDLVTGSPAKGVLQQGDVIIAVDGQAVRSWVELGRVLSKIAPGTVVPMRIKRGTQEMPLSVPTTESTDPERKGTAAILAFIKDELAFDIPIPVKINAGPISGPSAGLMFTLQIIDQLTPGGIAGGMRVAGTGTIEPDGKVGRIGGVQQKVYTAEAAGADVLFVPRGNYADAAKVVTKIPLVPVDTVRDALDWLKGHRKEAGHSSPAFWLSSWL